MRKGVFLISFPLNNEVLSGIDLEITQRAITVLEEELSFLQQGTTVTAITSCMSGNFKNAFQ